ncbi:hypothetical protein [Pseudomonas sp. GGS8]|uniref:hypothetical protein n=1 Tax=Pseudomonas sp. GGS8 TaxID=2817892 RepID=UPI0020A04342|nr:hypothetical protein [Pseudomonas sp. GGS8]
MKRTAIMTLAIASTLLLGGCWPYWEEGDRYDHDHRREYRRDHDRGYDQRDDRGYDRDYDRRDDRRRHRDNNDDD